MLGLSTAESRRWWTLAAVSLNQLLMVLDGTIINVAHPRAQTDLGFSDAGRQWVVTGYALAFGSFLLLGGRVADFWGRKRTYLLGLRRLWRWLRLGWADAQRGGNATVLS